MSETGGKGPMVVGIDLGGTNMQFGVVDSENRIIGRAKKKTKAQEGADRVVERLAKGVREACEMAGMEPGDVDSVGIAAAGAIDMPNGVVLDAPNLGWTEFPLRDRLSEALQRPVILENDVNGAIWGEWRLGAAKDRGDAFGIWVGTGVGGGLVLNNRIYRGEFFTAGEIGHTNIEPDAPPGRAKLEEICSRTGMSRTILSRLHNYPDSMLNNLVDPATGVTGSKMLAKAYSAGDELTLDVVHLAADRLGKSIANVVTLLAIDTVVIGGGVTEALDAPFLQRILESFDAHVFPDRCRACQLLPTRLRDDAGLLGVAILARESD